MGHKFLAICGYSGALNIGQFLFKSRMVQAWMQGIKILTCRLVQVSIGFVQTGYWIESGSVVSGQLDLVCKPSDTI